MIQLVRLLIVISGMMFVPQAGGDVPPRSGPDVKTPILTAEQVLERYIDSIGGREAYRKITSMAGKGTLKMIDQGIQGAMEFYAKVPNKRLEVGTIEGIGEVRQGFDGAIGWSEDPFQGLREMEGVELAILKREATFYSELKWRELFKKVELVGKEKVGDQDAFVVRLTPETGSPVTRYYDSQSFLLLREDSVQEGPQGTVPIQEYFTDYREIDGVKVPFQVVQKSPLGDAVTRITEIQMNVEIDDAKFAKPQPSSKGAPHTEEKQMVR